MSNLANIMDRIVAAKCGDENELLGKLMAEHVIDSGVRSAASRKSAMLIEEIRTTAKLGRMDALLAEYGLATDEGVALLRLAEALIRVPDAATADALIADKIVPVAWECHRGKSNSRFVNATTLGLMLASYCLEGSPAGGLSGISRRALKTASTPFVRMGMRTAINLLAGRFVLGRTMEEAISKSSAAEKKGFSFSYDMLGEAALTAADAEKFFEDYKNSIRALKPKCTADDFRDNHGISIKLSALHPRYELTQEDRVLTELGDRVLILSKMAKDANLGMNIDAEEADRLELSLGVIEKVLRDPDLAGWDGFGVVVQAYGKAAPHVLDWLYCLAEELDRRIMVRLVKGAYWDAEIKRAQVEGLEDFPVFTRKEATDVSYLSCAKKLLGMADRIYPQLAGHNAHTVSAILEMAGDQRFEFQRIHGMGEALHDVIKQRNNTSCRIYAPVGNHLELLPYLARRLLENGANSSFVNQIADTAWKAEDIAKDPFEILESGMGNISVIREPRHLFGPERVNSKGWDLHNPGILANLEELRAPHKNSDFAVKPIVAADVSGGEGKKILDPAWDAQIVGECRPATKVDVGAALSSASDWSSASAEEKARILIRASNIYEEKAGEFFALLCREAGKTPRDAVAELREAVDFLRYYGAECKNIGTRKPLGLVACISPWNFPLAIFTGQVAGALAAGNGVLAKPAGQTPLVAGLSVRCLHEAGVPRSVLQLLPGAGSVVGADLVSDPRISGVAFTGSTETARGIDRSMAEFLSPEAKLIAETGGQNAMIVDSTALPEQVIRDVILSSFQSTGQRCSALRMLYLQKDIYSQFVEMLFGAMDELRIGDPWDVSTDIGPMIDETSKQEIAAHIEAARQDGRLLKQCSAPVTGCFVGPAVIRVGGIEDLEKEVFGPILHITSFVSKDVERIVEAINNSGYGLTFGMHSRIDRRVRTVAAKLNVGNIYVNRNQIGAVVGSQPFGGEGLSGTGPKAGGPDYLAGFTREQEQLPTNSPASAQDADVEQVQFLLDRSARVPRTRFRTDEMPGPTGESNVLGYYPRGTVLCLGASAEDAEKQADAAVSAGCQAILVADGATGENAVQGILPRAALATLDNVDAVVLWSDEDDLRQTRQSLAARNGPFVPLISTRDIAARCMLERHVCIDTTAAGGNAALFAEVSEIGSRRRIAS